MTAERETPRDEFAAELRTWFVSELSRSIDDVGSRPPPSSGGTVVIESVRPARDDDRTSPGARRRAWRAVGSAAAVAVLVTGLVLANRSRVLAPEPVTTGAVTSESAIDRAARTISGLDGVCRAVAADDIALPTGATAEEIERVMAQIDRQVLSARQRFEKVRSGTGRDLATALDLLAQIEAGVAAVRQVAGSGGEALDASIANLDLVRLAWGRALGDELEALGADRSVCDALPTMREVRG